MSAIDLAPVTVHLDGHGPLVVHPGTDRDTVGDLVQALAPFAGPADTARSLWVDDRVWPPDTRLVDSGLRAGSRLRLATRSDGAPHVTALSAPPSDGAVAELRVVAGPDAGHVWRLRPGRHLLGRSPTAELRLAAGDLEPHHLLVEVATDGRCRVRQLAGHVPARCGDRPLAPGGTALVPGDVVHLGPTSLAVVHPSGSGAATAHSVPDGPDPWRRPLQRVTRRAAPPEPAPIHLPTAPGRATGAGGPALAPVLISLGLAIVLAAVSGRGEMVWFAAFAAVAGLGLWVHHGARRMVRLRREGARHRREVSEAREAMGLAHRQAALLRWRAHPELAELVRRASERDPRCWVRRPHRDADAWTVTLGRGDPPWSPDLVDERGETVPAERAVEAGLGVPPTALHGVPVTVDLSPGAVIGLEGPGAAALARALVVQLAVQVGPADWQLAVASGSAGRDAGWDAGWDGCRWLPQLASPETGPMVPDDLAELAATVSHDDRHLVVVVLDPALLASRTGPVRQVLAAARGSAAVLVVDDHPGPAGRSRLPSWCTSRVRLGPAGGARLVDHGAAPVELRPAGLQPGLFTAAAAALAGWSDPEAPDAGSTLPAEVRLSSLTGAVDAAALARRWSEPPGNPVAPLGAGASGPVHVDLATDGPHALVAGTTGAGKSELLRTLVCGLALGTSPEHLSFVLVDYKGGSAFDVCASLPHVAGVVTDLDAHLGERVLLGLDAELRRRERVLREAGVADLDGLRSLPAHRRPSNLARLVVVVDEFATMAVELPDFLGALVAVAQRGRSLGVHLVLATQRPAGVVRDDVRANTNLRISLRVQSTAEAHDVVGDAAPATFPRQLPGRAMACLGGEERLVFQTAAVSCPPPPAGGRRLRVVLRGAEPSPADGSSSTELELLVRAACDAARQLGLRPPAAPWIPPLPDRLVEAPPGAVGLLDDPEHQRQLPLVWAAHGHLVVCGGRRSGSTSTLATAVRTVAAGASPSALHVYVLDGGGSGALAGLRSLPHTGDVVPAGDAERVRRLLRRLDDELDERRLDAGRRARRVVLAVDGVGAVRTAVEADPELQGWFDRLCLEGPALGMVLAVTAERPGVVGAALSAGTEARWVHRMSDPVEAASLGVAALPADGPPGQVVDAATGLRGQVLAPDAAPVPAPGAVDPTDLPAAVRPLPAVVPTLSAGPSIDAHGTRHLPLGVGERDLQEVAVEVGSGEHMLVLGPSRSGRTSTLHRLADGWRRLHPTGCVIGIEGRVPARRQLAAGLDASCPTLLVVDDAELVDDADGTLQHALASASADVTVLAAARPDALRGAFGHWTSIVRRSRLGLVLGPAGDLDGDLLGCMLPRAWPIRPRPGLGWLVQRGEARLVQVAMPPEGGDQAASSTPSVMCTVRSQ